MPMIAMPDKVIHRAPNINGFFCASRRSASRRLRYTWPLELYSYRQGGCLMKKHGPWAIKKRKSVYKGELIEVFEDEVVQPDGEDGKYSTVKLMNGASVLALDDEGFAYFIREFRYALSSKNVETVGGAIDEGEEPIEAARRELREELGIEAEEWTELGLMSHSTSVIDSASTLFLARVLSFTEKDEDSGEVIETVKMPFTEAIEKALGGEFIDANTCVLVLRAQHYLRKNS
jgi:8-oxo-dGTP pyrophosphatase MutT (NUDIX family)